MKRVIEKIRKFFAEMNRAYKEAAPYMPFNHYEYPTMQVAF